jgi:invasion protein IalB
MRCYAVVVAAVSMSVAAVVAQKQEMPKSGPEHQRPGAFFGNWSFEGELKPGPMGLAAR